MIHDDKELKVPWDHPTTIGRITGCLQSLKSSPSSSRTSCRGRSSTWGMWHMHMEETKDIDIIFIINKGT